MAKITIQELEEEVNCLTEEMKAQKTTFAPQVQVLFDDLEPVDFRAKAGMRQDSNPTKKQMIVIAVDELQQQLKDMGSGIQIRNGQCYLYCNNYWNALPDEDARALLTYAVIRIGIDELEAKHFETQDKCFKQLASVSRFDRYYSDGSSGVIINLRNTTLAVSPSGKVTTQEPCREDFITYQLQFDYTPGATCPNFTNYLNEVLPDPSAQWVLAEYIANCLMPGLNLQKALMLKGDGSNGKSVFCEIITALLGRENVSSFSMASLTKENSTSRPMLQGKLLNYSGENSLKMDVEYFKLLVNGEPIEARMLYGQSFIMEHYARLMFNCNQLPKDIEQSDAFFRRFLIIPFNVKITEEKRNPHLAADIIKDELPGVFNWVLEGLQRLIKQQKYTECDAARAELDTYRKESSSVLMFLDEGRLLPGEDVQANRCKLSFLYGEYGAYCSQNGYRYPVTKRAFGPILRASGYKERRQADGIVYIIEDYRNKLKALKDGYCDGLC